LDDGLVAAPPRLARRDVGSGLLGFELVERGAPGEEDHERIGRRPGQFGC
jgi:hypothetical protein